MFDLNIDLSAENPAYKDLRMPSGSEAYQVTEPSGTSESSEVVVVGGDDPDSGNSTSILNFDIFTKLRMSTAEVVPDEDENDLDDFLGNHGHPQFHTRQLFPLKGDSGGGGIGGLSCDYEFRAGSSETRWLNLSVSGSGTGSGSLQQSDKKNPPQQQQVRRSRRGPRSRSSQYRGVTFYRRTGRWESHIWDCGKQVYLGGFDTAYAAARAYDRAAIRFRGVEADINFTISDYEEEMKQMNNLTKEEFVHTLRRQSSGFPRGSSRYRAANLQKYGQLEAQTGRYLGNRPYHNGRETITTFYPRNYEMKMPVEAINREIGQNLELNLGISNSAHCTRGNKSIGEGNPYSPLCHPADGRRPMLGSSYWPPSGQAVASTSQSAMWPGFSVIHAEREKQVESVGPSRLSKRSGSIHGGANQVVPLFSSAAASSGFSC